MSEVALQKHANGVTNKSNKKYMGLNKPKLYYWGSILLNCIVSFIASFSRPDDAALIELESSFRNSNKRTQRESNTCVRLGKRAFTIVAQRQRHQFSKSLFQSLFLVVFG